MVWLCSEHQKQDGVAVLSDEVADLNVTSQEPGIDVNSAFKDLTLSGSWNKVDAGKPRTASWRTAGSAARDAGPKQTGL